MNKEILNVKKFWIGLFTIILFVTIVVIFSIANKPSKCSCVGAYEDFTFEGKNVSKWSDCVHTYQKEIDKYLNGLNMKLMPDNSGSTDGAWESGAYEYFKSSCDTNTIKHNDPASDTVNKTNSAINANKSKDSIQTKNNQQSGNSKAYDEIIFTGTVSDDYSIKFRFASGYDIANVIDLINNKSHTNEQFIRVPDYEKVTGEQLYYRSYNNSKTYFTLKLKSDPDTIPNILYGTYSHDNIVENFIIYKSKN